MQHMKLTKIFFFAVSFHYLVSKYIRLNGVVDPGGVDLDPTLQIKPNLGPDPDLTVKKIHSTFKTRTDSSFKTGMDSSLKTIQDQDPTLKI